MARSKNPRDYIKELKSKRQAMLKEAEELKNEHRSYLDDAKQIDEKYEQTLQEMGAYLLPDVTEEALERLANALHDPQIRQLKQKMDQAIGRANKEAQELEQHPEIRKYNLLRGELESEIELLQPACDGIEQFLDIWLKSSWFHKLQEAHYFDAGYKPSLFQRFRNWKAASYLMAELESKQACPTVNGRQRFKDSAALKAEHQRVVVDGQGSIQTLKELRAHLLQVEKRKTHLDQLKAAPETELAKLYKNLQERIEAQLKASADAILQGSLGQDKHFVSYQKKLQALPKQSSYLRELSARRIAPVISDLENNVQKLDTKIERLQDKLNRGKSIYIDPNKAAADTAYDNDKWTKRRNKFTKMRSTISTFDRYDQGSIVGEFLWWDLISRGAAADDLMEVKRFHQKHPGWDYRTHGSHGHAIDLAADDLANSHRDSDADFS